MEQKQIDAIITNWLETAFAGKTAITLSSISSAGFLKSVFKYFKAEADAVIREKTAYLFEHPLFDKSIIDSGENELIGELKRIMENKTAFNREIVERILRENFDTLFSDKLSKEIEFTAETTETAAREIFTRAVYYSGAAADIMEFDCEVLSAVCEMANQKLIADAIRVEKELGTFKMNLQQLTMSIRRSLLLREHISEKSVQQSIIAAPSEAKNSNEPIFPIEKPKPVSSLKEKLASIGEETQESDKPGAAPVKSAEVKPAGLRQLIQKEKASGIQKPVEPVNVQGKVEKSKPAEKIETKTVKGADKKTEVIGKTANTGLSLREKLLLPENADFFTDNLYEGNGGKYRIFLDKLCSQDNLKHALTETSNELYYLDIPESEIAAAKLVRTIKEHYK